ncbi:MAG TPA: tripartite tricarboxylate transporter substrate binding protein [Burkholderiales bacterium]|nr:tripartite tricarboxylate transporter substrate binding protein [Burkholderiales bacterium]
MRAALLVLLLAASAALAQTYPAKSVRIVVPFPPGGGTDLFARATAQKLSATLGQQFIVDNRSGAGGMIGSDAVAKAQPDGYILLITSSSTHSINPHLAKKPLYDPLRDFTPIALIASAPNLLVVHPSLPARTVKELIALAKARPGQLAYASNGTGTLSHLTGELFKLRAGTNLLHVPYKGGPPALIDLVAGQVAALFTAVPTASPHMRAGRLRALAVTGGKRADALPDVPALAETIPGFESSQWWGFFAPAGFSADITARLNAEVEKIVRDAEVRKRFAAEGADPAGGSPAEFAAFLRADYDKWRKVVAEAGVRPE